MEPDRDCSCHICPPCQVCLDAPDPDAEPDEDEDEDGDTDGAE